MEFNEHTAKDPIVNYTLYNNIKDINTFLESVGLSEYDIKDVRNYYYSKIVDKNKWLLSKIKYGI